MASRDLASTLKLTVTDRLSDTDGEVVKGVMQRHFGDPDAALSDDPDDKVFYYTNDKIFNEE